ncbi:OmpA family protein [Sphingobacterium paludis]|uniref:Outer membrane protein OmpA-like peptidoglycan-associated protein n=1 Tax=Sphingobacterium paludis TaxID=1476465 RepID=A0A4R7DBR2_9SPHI|nr:OmpA family protein [Sphingobacterium paludis]TDS17344.1 outer membrane protein OmpA-like peptidoglycan-associated protein [Sphingobacterium paludis]
MKRISIICVTAHLLFACNPVKTTETDNTDSVSTEQSEALDQAATASVSSEHAAFDITRIPVSTVDIGDFPFFTAPEGSLYINKPKVSNFDFIVFVTPDDIYEVEGKTFRAHVHPDRKNKSENEVSGRYLTKSFEDAIVNAGGVKVFEGRLLDARKDKYTELCTYAGSNGSIDIWNNSMATYIIRRDDGNVYIALDKDKGNSTSIQIVQEKPFEQTIKKITSDKIESDLTETGKSVLHINFETDKATLKPEGTEAIQEIIKVLSKNTALKIAIHGYTDNVGTKEHNQKLSESRATAVKNEITKSGISADRLTSKGFGQEDPIADNGTEEGKAQNRRVELVKLK